MPLSDLRYGKTIFPKTKIVLHWTAGVGNPTPTFEARGGRNGVAYYVDRKGGVDVLFQDIFWSNHLYDHSKQPWKELYDLEKDSIGIEVEAWGWLTHKGDTLRTWTGDILCTLKDTDEYFEENYRGQKYFQSLTFPQIITLQELCKSICKKHNIPYIYLGHSLIQSVETLKNFSGILCHANYRKDKFDYPNYIWEKIK